MGKGDKKTRRGKIIKGSYGVRRRKRKRQKISKIPLTKKKEAPKRPVRTDVHPGGIVEKKTVVEAATEEISVEEPVTKSAKPKEVLTEAEEKSTVEPASPIKEEPVIKESKKTTVTKVTEKKVKTKPKDQIETVEEKKPERKEKTNSTSKPKQGKSATTKKTSKK